MHFLKNKWLLLLVIALAVIGLDQISKNWVLDNLALYQSMQPVPMLAPFFQFTRSANTGAAFGMLPNASDMLLVLAVVIVIAILIYYPRTHPDAHVTRLAMALVVGGALGNIIDRLQHGHVVDFIHYQVPPLISNVSNLADHAIVLGVLVLMIHNWRRDQQIKTA